MHLMRQKVKIEEEHSPIILLNSSKVLCTFAVQCCAFKRKRECIIETIGYNQHGKTHLERKEMKDGKSEIQEGHIIIGCVNEAQQMLTPLTNIPVSILPWFGTCLELKRHKQNETNLNHQTMRQSSSLFCKWTITR